MKDNRKEQLLEQARRHWKECTSDTAERENRERGRQDAAFAMGQQWDEADKRQRDAEGRPSLVMNKITGFLHMVENEARRNRISIVVSPSDDGIDKETAKIDQGLIRYIQYNSKSEMAIQAAFMEACRSALGAFKLVGQYAPRSMDQDLYIEQIPDAINRVWWSPFSKLLDRSDSPYCFETVIIPRERFKAMYPKSEVCSETFMDDGYGNRDDDWITYEGVRLANYYYVEEAETTLYQLADGTCIYEDEMQEGDEVIGERPDTRRTVKIATINGHEVLDETEWKGSNIPVFPVCGEEVYVEGRKARFSLIHFAIDPQRLYNYYRSNEAEAIGLTPKAPWIMAEGQDEGYEAMWQNANRKNYSSLPYKPVTVGGVTLPPPQRNVAEPPIQALSLGAAQASDDAKAAVSIYDASLGNRSNETSGTAIAQRKEQTGLANLHFADNLGTSLCACGRSIVEVKPFYYDTDRMVRILGEDETQQIVRANATYVDDKGVERLYDLTSSRYDVRVSTGPSYMTQRQEAWASMTEWIRSWPELLQIAGDLVIKNSDIPGADGIAERIKKTLDPKLLSEKEDAQSKISPEVQAQMQALQQMVEQLTAALQQANDESAIKKAELDSKERIANLDAMVKVAMKEADLGHAEALEEFRQTLNIMKQQMDALRAEKERQFQPEGPGTDTGAGYPEAA